jgi:hypothetical protein
MARYRLAVDVAIWIAVVAALVAMSGAGAATWQRHGAKRSAVAAKGSADAAWLALDIALRHFEIEHPEVAWRVDPLGGSRFQLRNVGRTTATGVSLTVDGDGEWIVEDLPTDAVIPDGGGQPFTLAGPIGAKLAAVRVRWDGQPQGKAVPMPPLSAG